MSLLPPIPRRKRFRIIIRGIFLFFGVTAAFFSSLLIQEKEYYWAILPTGIVLIAAIIEFVFGDILTEKRYPARTETILENYQNKVQNVHDQLLAQLKTAIKSLKGCDIEKVNGTLHLLVELFPPTGDILEHAFVQITKYSGQLGGTSWRFSHVSEGIIGRCFRTRAPEWVNFATQEEYNDKMVREFGYTHDNVKQHTMTARSYWAQPLWSDGDFAGVMYLFSTEPQVFPRAANQLTLEGIASNVVSILKAASII